MNERQLVWSLTLGGVLAITIGLGLAYTHWRFRQTAIHTTGVIKVTPDQRWLLRFKAGDREIELPLEGENYHEDITSHTAGSRIPILCDPEQPTNLDTVTNNTAGTWGGMLLATVGAVFTLLGGASLRYLSRSSVRTVEEVEPGKLA